MLYRYKIRPLSPFITPLMSDTFFGHFCWALRYEKGEAFLTEFLHSYGEGKVAPVLFSSAFESGTLPRPVLPPLGRMMTRKFVEDHFVNNSENLFNDKTEKQRAFIGMNQIKVWNKRKYINLDMWKRLKNDYSELRVLEVFFEEYKNGRSQGISSSYKTEVTASNTISRISGTVSAESGGLFQREKVWFIDGVDLDLYVEINSEEMIPIVSQFLTDYLPKTGFGADKTVGMGELSIIPDDAFGTSTFAVEVPNARLSLSLAAFQGIEDFEAYYNLKAKFGRLGGDYAISSPTGGNPKPFKKPLLMFEPGAVFLFEKALNTKPLLENVHSDKKIRHCGIPVTLPFIISEDITNEGIAA